MIVLLVSAALHYLAIAVALESRIIRYVLCAAQTGDTL